MIYQFEYLTFTEIAMTDQSYDRCTWHMHTHPSTMFQFSHQFLKIKTVTFKLHTSSNSTKPSAILRCWLVSFGARATFYQVKLLSFLRCIYLTFFLLIWLLGCLINVRIWFFQDHSLYWHWDRHFCMLVALRIAAYFIALYLNCSYICMPVLSTQQ